MLVYEKVREYIETQGLRPGAVAEASNIPNAAMNAMLNGKRKMYAEDLTAICLALGLPASHFVEQQQSA